MLSSLTLTNNGTTDRFDQQLRVEMDSAVRDFFERACYDLFRSFFGVIGTHSSSRPAHAILTFQRTYGALPFVLVSLATWYRPIIAFGTSNVWNLDHAFQFQPWKSLSRRAWSHSNNRHWNTPIPNSVPFTVECHSEMPNALTNFGYLSKFEYTKVSLRKLGIILEIE